MIYISVFFSILFDVGMLLVFFCVVMENLIQLNLIPTAETATSNVAIQQGAESLWSSESMSFSSILSEATSGLESSSYNSGEDTDSRYDNDRFESDRYESGSYDNDSYETDGYDNDSYGSESYENDGYDNDNYADDSYDNANSGSDNDVAAGSVDNNDKADSETGQGDNSDESKETNNLNDATASEEDEANAGLIYDSQIQSADIAEIIDTSTSAGAEGADTGLTEKATSDFLLNNNGENSNTEGDGGIQSLNNKDAGNGAQGNSEGTGAGSMQADSSKEEIGLFGDSDLEVTDNEKDGNGKEVVKQDVLAKDTAANGNANLTDANSEGVDSANTKGASAETTVPAASVQENKLTDTKADTEEAVTSDKSVVKNDTTKNETAKTGADQGNGDSGKQETMAKGSSQAMVNTETPDDEAVIEDFDKTAKDIKSDSLLKTETVETGSENESLPDIEELPTVETLDDTAILQSSGGAAAKGGTIDFSNPSTGSESDNMSVETVKAQSAETIKSDSIRVVQREAAAPKVLNINDQTFVITKKSDTSIEVTLKPDGMGKLDIGVNLEKGVITAQINAADPAGKELIEKNLQSILNALEKEGLNIGGFSVSLKEKGGEPGEGSQKKAGGQDKEGEDHGDQETGEQVARQNEGINIVV